MDIQTIVDGMHPMCCAVSVEKLGEDRYGEFLIVAGNQAYIDSIEKPAPGMNLAAKKFVPNSPYTEYLSRDLNFEAACVGAAIRKECIHSYVRPERMDVWLNMNFLPLSFEEGNRSFCLYMMEVQATQNSTHMAELSEGVAADVLKTCIKLRGATDFRETMADVIKDIRQLCDAEHCCILTMNEAERSCEVLCEDFREGSGLLPMSHYLDNSFYDIAESWESTIAGSNCIIAGSEQDMEVIQQRNPVWYASLSGAGAKSIVLFPLRSRDQLLGYMWAINFDSGHAQKIKETLELTTFVLGSELGNYLLLDRLKVLSTMDLLTGVLNRNEMNHVVDELCKGECGPLTSVAVIFADLNGLKRTNDLEGHNAGDRLLKDAAKSLCGVFDRDRIFRAGGDEFCVILTGITWTVLQQKIEEIRKSAEKYPNLSFAIGGCVEQDYRNVRRALKNADADMYEDKRKYYAQHPTERQVTPRDAFRLGDTE